MSFDTKKITSVFVDLTNEGNRGLDAKSCGFGYIKHPEGIQVDYKEEFFAIGLSKRSSEIIVGEVMDSICFCLERGSNSNKSVFLLLIKDPVSEKNMLYSIEASYWNEKDIYGDILHLNSSIKDCIEINDSIIEISFGNSMDYDIKNKRSIFLKGTNFELCLGEKNAELGRGSR